ncbi:MAG: hypothetical protein Q8O37_12885 [Sulfuricellaceae bacterium]|nr:hypothetical protein [Sulfuricellaceae bacterium]
MDTIPISATKFIAGVRKTWARKTTSNNWPIAILTATLTITSLQVQADSWVSAGNAPASSGGGLSLAMSSKTSEKFGWGLGIVFNGEIAGNDVLDYPVPHNNYTNLGTKRTGNAIGLDALWFPAGESAWRPYAGLGLYYDKRAEIAQSNVTGWYYTQKGKSALNMGGELGLQYRTSSGAIWGMGCHTIRGGFLSVGWVMP